MAPPDVEAMRRDVAETIRAVTALTVDPATAPIVDVRADPTLIGKLMFANSRSRFPRQPRRCCAARKLSTHPAGRQEGPLRPVAECEKLSPMRAITLRDGLFEATLHHMVHDERLIAYGEECREWGGAFGVYRGLSDIMPYHRLFNSPISEAAIVATAVGYALAGGRALVELMYGDFIGRAGDEIFNQMSKWRSMSGGSAAGGSGSGRRARGRRDSPACSLATAGPSSTSWCSRIGAAGRTSRTAP